VGLFMGAMLAGYTALSWRLIPSLGAAGPAAAVAAAEGLLTAASLVALALARRDAFPSAGPAKAQSNP
jgi:hypothetical protein